MISTHTNNLCEKNGPNSPSLVYLFLSSKSQNFYIKSQHVAKKKILNVFLKNFIYGLNSNVTKSCKACLGNVKYWIISYIVFLNVLHPKGQNNTNEKMENVQKPII
jgi:hypothetical protein